MFDYVLLTKDDVSAAVSYATAHLFQTIPKGSSCKAICVDNSYDVDVVVVIGGAKVIYLKHGSSKTCDLTSDNATLAPPSSDLLLKVYAPGGTPPGSGSFIADCMF